MEIRPSPLPGWAWDLIEQVERGERRPGLVTEIEWRVARGSRYDRIAVKVRSGNLRSSDKERSLESLRRAKERTTKYSSGRATPWSGRVTITAGSSLLDQRMVLLHEMAHLLAPVREGHGKVWRRIVTRLYAKYGGPEIVEWSLTSERSPILRRYIRERQGANG
jgi:hypothetical protein